MFKNILLMLLLIGGNNHAWAESKTTFYHYDLLGSPVATTDQAGNVLWREEYSPWGEKLLKEDASHDNVRDYTGHVHDKDTGLTYMQARYYDPQIGRFMGIDPVGFKEDNPIMFNRYAYANNNPFKFTDPNGEQPNLMKGGGFINAQIDLHATDAEMASIEMGQAKSLLDNHPKTKFTFNAYHTQMSNFADLKKDYGDRVVLGGHISKKDKWLGSVKSQVAAGYEAGLKLGQKPRQTPFAAHGTYSKDTEKEILAHMKGPKDSYRLNAKTLAKDELVAENFKNKDSSYYGHLNEMNDGSEVGKTQNDNFDHIEKNLAE